MKRLVLAAVLLSSCAVVAAHGAPCDGPGVAAGDHGEATVTYTRAGKTVNIHTSAFGNFAVGPAQVCADGSVGVEPTTGFVTVKVDGVEICTNTSKPPAFDPFVFGGGVHDDPADACGADVTWDGLTWLISPSAPKNLPDPLPIGPDATGAHAGDLQPAAVDGVWWYTDFSACTPEDTLCVPPRYELHVPAGTVGWFSNHGAQVAVYS